MCSLLYVLFYFDSAAINSYLIALWGGVQLLQKHVLTRPYTSVIQLQKYFQIITQSMFCLASIQYHCISIKSQESFFTPSQNSKGKVMQISIPTRNLRAALACSPKSDVRYYLNGICVHFKKNGYNLVSTDGGVLLCIFTSAKIESEFVGKKFIIPRAFMYARKEGKFNVLLTLTHDFVECQKTKVKQTYIEGRYPDYAQAIPRTVNGKRAIFAVDVLTKFETIAKELKVSSQIAHNGDSASVATGDNFVCVLMPMRNWELSQGEANATLANAFSVYLH